MGKINFILLIGSIVAFVLAIIGLNKNSIMHTASGVIVLAVTLFLVGLGVNI